MFKQAEQVWVSIKKKGDRNPDIELTWKSLKNKMLADESETRIISIKSKKTRWYLAAASIIVVLGISLFITQGGYERIATTENLEVFYLPDSSIIYLNKNSKLKYPKEFGAERIVHLEGEAYFKIKRDTLRPFIIETESTRTKVLGTSFDLKAYDGNDKVQLVVESGEVEFASKEIESDKVVLQKDEMGVLKHKENGMMKQKNDDPNFMSWKNDKEELKRTKQYKNEYSSPSTYLYTQYNWKENIIKQTIIDGRLHSAAIFTTYKNVKMRASYYSSNGKKLGKEEFTVNKTVYPGLFVYYKYKLNNWLENTKEVRVEIVEAKVAEE